VPLFTDKATGEAADYEIAPGGRRLGVIGVYDPGDISRARLHTGNHRKCPRTVGLMFWPM
jgi:hypothetical protein